MPLERLYLKDFRLFQEHNFSFTEGTNLILGKNGSGKTSIINSINRFYEFQKGKILVDGVDIKKINSSDLRDNLGLVSQDVFLFSDTIYNNITLFNDKIDESQVWESIDQVGARKFIESLPNKLNFNVKERGASLSVGQRQLISFLRAYIKNP